MSNLVAMSAMLKDGDGNDSVSVVDSINIEVALNGYCLIINYIEDLPIKYICENIDDVTELIKKHI
jgi:hypothetical protein